MKIKLLVLALILLTKIVKSQDEVIPGEFITELPTLTCLGFEWYIDGDENRNAKVEVSYRLKGKENWKEALPLLRIGGEKAGIDEWNYITPHMFAGSIFDLDHDSEYECKFIMTDPDGMENENIKIVNVKTRKVPEEYEGGRVRHVWPNTHDYRKDGYYSFNRRADDDDLNYDGLLHAYYGYRRYADWVLTTDPVQPGDIIIVHAGVYKANPQDYRDYHGTTFDGLYTLTRKGTEEKPITIKAAGDGEVIFDGEGIHTLFNLMGADHHIIEGITFRNPDIAIVAGRMNLMGCDGLAIKNCKFENIGIGIMGQYEGSKNYYIADNYFVGREDTSAMYKTRGRNALGQLNQHIASYYAVKVHGQGHVICHNSVRYFFDGIDICTHSAPEKEQDKKSVSIDIYNNDIFLCNDNFIETDGGMHNIRVMRNRGFNAAQAGWSSQPVLGGPAYWIRNVGFNTPYSSAFKWWGMDPAGVIAYHNTFSTFNTRFFNACSNVHFRNNLFIPPDEETFYGACALYSYTSYSSSDYNGYRIHEGMEKPVRWNMPQEKTNYELPNAPEVFQNLRELAAKTGQEKHSLEVDDDIFLKWLQPLYDEFYTKFAAYPLYYPHQVDFRLKENAKVVDKGLFLPNINENHRGKAPDMGAIEQGEEIPVYGPRNINY
jgi:hypothetical protein